MADEKKKSTKKQEQEEDIESGLVAKPVPKTGRVDILGEMRKFFWIILISTMVVVPLSVWGTQKITKLLEPNPYPMRAVGLAPGAKIDRNFTLYDQNDKSVSGEKYSSRAWAVFFGFTHCPDVCPVTLSRLSGLWGQIKNKERIQLFFITVDPARDTAEVLKEYMRAFDPGFIALTGEDVKIEAIKKQFRVYSKKVQEQGNPAYSVDHTATVFLLRSDGVFVGTIDMDEPDESVLGKLKNLTGG